MNRATLLSLKGTQSIQDIEITTEIPGDKNLMLVNCSIIIEPGLKASQPYTPRVLNLEIPGLNKTYVIDSNPTINTLQINNRWNVQTVSGVITNVSEYQPMVTYYFSNYIHKHFTAKLLDDEFKPMDGTVLDPGVTKRPTIKSWFFQFQVI